jgi:hypothetical protein
MLDPSCKAEFMLDLPFHHGDSYIQKMTKLFLEAYAGHNASDGMMSHSSTMNKSEWGTHDSRESFLKRRKLNSGGSNPSSLDATTPPASVAVNGTSGEELNEMEVYLKEPLATLNLHHPYAIFHWWKMNSDRFPNLSRMARDFLGCPVSTLSNELIFKNSHTLALPEHLANLPFSTLKKILLSRSWLNRSTKMNI